MRLLLLLLVRLLLVLLLPGLVVSRRCHRLS